MLHQPRGKRFPDHAFDHPEKALNWAGETCSCYFCALMKPCDAQDGLMNSPYKQLLKMASPFCQNLPSRSSETRVLTKSLVP